MCYLAAMLLIHLTRPQDCFVTFTNLVYSFDILYSFFTADQLKVNHAYKVFWRLLKEHTPLLYQYLKETDATLRIFFFPWVITLFSNSFSMDTCASLWDQIFFFGENQIFKIAIAIC
mmetsp:Transcript_6734/g.10824  ORF Transcript_6734/g.10824 Transcript_6734/m.10824 type:complete len:117 (-) Transcript_6734:318-668(-)